MQRSLFKSLLRVKLPAREIGILFKHRRNKIPFYDSTTCKAPLNGITYCEIYQILGDGMATIIVCGRGYCKVPDTFCKKTGRKRSLTSALAKTMVMSKQRLFSRDERELIWTAYWERTAPKTELQPYGPIPLAAGSLIDAQGNIIGGE